MGDIAGAQGIADAAREHERRRRRRHSEWHRTASLADARRAERPLVYFPLFSLVFPFPGNFNCSVFAY